GAGTTAGGLLMLWICLQCTTAYSVGADGCPHCGSHEYAEEGTEMAKISRHGGPSNKTTGTATVELVIDSEPGPGGIITDPVLTTGGEDGPELVVALDDAPAVVSPYDGMLRADLQELCRTRGLSASGNKDELVARLTAADETEPDGELGTVPVDPA
ncbi:MAG TPA: SAP domain-containing protein, partial [Jiangellales bacterium]|nr:SAP domain-containing protein [Jiangellales bacterium]